MAARLAAPESYDMDQKSSVIVSHDEGSMVDVTPGAVSEKLGTGPDQRGMIRMGKKQELRRQFHFFSITGYAVILGCSWEFAMINIVLTLTNGGKAGSIWELVVAICGMFFVTMSFAEMASIAPTAGGQYHWTSEFAPKRLQKVLSYYVGVFCVLGWQTSLAATCYASAQQITALAVLGNAHYSPKLWQTSLISFAVMCIVVLANTVLFRKLPLIEGCIMFVHVFAFFAFIIVLWIMAPRSDASSVFTEFSSNGWPSTGVAFLVGVTGPLAYLTGGDSTVHLGEEVRNSSFVIPRSMLVTALSNYVLSFVAVVTLIFCLGDLDAVSSSPIGQPYLAIVLNATKSTGATMALGFVMLVLVVSCSINGLTTTSRQIWAFGRDGGPPFSSWLSQVRPGLDIPLNAMSVSIVFSIILNLIAMGSTEAYDIFVSLNLSGLLTSYIVCIGCILYRRLYGEKLPRSRWDLGKFGIPINAIAVSFLTLIWIFQFFPSSPNPTVGEMNWSCVIYGAVLIIFSLHYIFQARFTYEGPVVYVRKNS